MNPVAETTMQPAAAGTDVGGTATASAESGVEKHVSAPIPVRSRPNGPVTRRRLRRTFAWIASGWALGVALLVAGTPAAWNAFGLGLFLPGGGFV